MTSRPIYRWKRFWLGLFVACFLIWACWDGYRNGAAFAYSWGTGTFFAAHGQGASYVGLMNLGYWGLEWLHGRPFDIVEREEAWRRSGVHYFRIPDPLVFLSFLGLWSGWLAWRWRHLQKLAGEDISE